MDEALSYKWAGQILKRVDKLLEPHINQQLADNISAAILAAYKLSHKVIICKGCNKDEEYCLCDAFK